MKFKDMDREVDRVQDQDDLVQEDLYGNDPDSDLSDDPMMAAEPKVKSRKERRKAKERQQHKEYMAREREAMKAEILAELRAESGSVDAVQEQDEKESTSKRGRRKSTSKEGEKQNTDVQHERKGSRFSEYLMSILSGNILSREEVRRVYPYLLFMALLAFLYIVNVFDMQQLHRQREQLTQEVKELRARAMITTSYRIQATRQSNIMIEVERRGIPLRESLAPNKVVEK